MKSLICLLLATALTSGLLGQSLDREFDQLEKSHFDILEAASKSSGTQSDLPSLCYLLDWNDTTQNWDSLRAYHYVWAFAAGEARIASRTDEGYIGGAFQSSYRISYQYDMWGNQSEIFEESWNGTAFERAYRISRTFDSEAVLVSEIVEQFNGITFDTASQTRRLVTYNTMNHPLEIIFEERDPNLSSWYPLNRRTYTYDANDERESIVLANWIGGAWKNTVRERGYTWYDFSKNFPSQLYQDIWVDSSASFETTGRVDYAYPDSYGSQYTYSFTYDAATMSYDSSLKLLYEQDAHGNPTLSEYYSRSFQTGNMEQYSGLIRHHTYNAYGEVTESINQRWDQATDTYVNSDRLVCLDFIVNAPQALETEHLAAWAPHPIGQQAQLLVKHDKPGQLQLEVFDLNGKALSIHHRMHAGGAQSHDFELGLSPGLYLYQLTINGTTKTDKLLIK